MSDIAISFDSVSFEYRGDWLQRIRALKDVTFHVPVGASFGFLGANGAGKSTSIKLLMGLIQGHQGAIGLFGEPLSKPEQRRVLGYLPEQPFFYENLQVREYLSYLGSLSGMSKQQMQQRSHYIYDVLDLGDLQKRKLGSFSKGMRQRFGLAQAIFHEPQLLVLDEPFSGLDPLWRTRFREVMQAERSRGATLFFSSHILSDVEDLCDSYAVIDKGVVLEQGTLSALLERAPLRMLGQGPMPAAAVACGEGKWFLHFADEERVATIASVLAGGGDILRLERQRHALEDYFVERVHASHHAGNHLAKEQA